jgi:hypothetical protein
MSAILHDINGNAIVQSSQDNGTHIGILVSHGAAPALLTLAADAGAFAALGGEDAGMAGVGVAPGQIGLQAPGQYGVVRVVSGVLRSAGTVREAGSASGPGWTGTRYVFTVRFPEGQQSLTATVELDQQGRVRRLVTITTQGERHNRPGPHLR